MRRFTFTEDQRRIIALERYCHPNPRVQRRMEMLWLKCNGETHERIAKLAGVDRRTVQRLLDLFETGGLESVYNFGEKGRANGLAPHREPVEAAFRELPPRTVDRSILSEPESEREWSSAARTYPIVSAPGHASA